MTKITALILALLCTPAIACEHEKVYPQDKGGMYTVQAVYRCSTSGLPDITYRPWVCRKCLTEGQDKVETYLPLCEGAKSEYDRLMDRIRSGEMICVGDHGGGNREGR